MPLSMNIGHRIGSRSGPAPIPRSVAALLRRKGASMVIPGVGVVDGFAAGNYFDSTGLTPAVIDGKVGRVNDAGFGGIHALQATDGFKPVERRGLVNLLTYSNDFSNAAWSKSNVTYTTGQFGPNGAADATRKLGASGAYEFQSIAVTAGQQLTFAFQAKNNGGAAATYAVYNNTSGGFVVPATSYLSQIADWNIVIVGITVPAGCSSIRVYPVAGPCDVLMTSAALFQGTVTAQDIIDAGGIPVTTTEPKSSSLGPRYWQFDGTDDRLQLSKAAWNLEDDWFYVAAIRPNVVADARLFFARGTTTTANLSGVILTATGRISAEHTGATAPFVTYSAGDACVIAAKREGSTISIRKNGGAWVSAVITGSPSGSYDGNPHYTSSENGINRFFNGAMYSEKFGKGAITDAELLLLEKFAGKLAGVQI